MHPQSPKVTLPLWNEHRYSTVMKSCKSSNTFYAQHITEWIDTFLVVVYLTGSMDHLYPDEARNLSPQTKQKEEGEKRRKLVSDDREWIGAEL